MSVTGWFAWIAVNELGEFLTLLPIGFGFLFGLAFFLIGVVTLATGRMRLTLDREAGIGIYDVYSPVIDVGKPCSFRIADIASVSMEYSKESRPRNDHQARFPRKVCRARLRLLKPRRAIVLDETENGQEDRVTKTASIVADWLNMEVIERGN